MVFVTENKQSNLKKTGLLCSISYLHSIIASIDDIDKLVCVVCGNALRRPERSNSAAFLPYAAQVFTVFGKHVDAMLPFV